MFEIFLKCKLHRGAITEAEIEYEGSIAIDEDLMDAAGLREYEKVLVANIDNSNRFETYVIKAPRGSKTLGLNGAAARLGAVGERITIFAWVHMAPEAAANHQPKLVLLNEENSIVNIS
jgi:aspartate 1-decarboxylase